MIIILFSNGNTINCIDSMKNIIMIHAIFDLIILEHCGQLYFEYHVKLIHKESVKMNVKPLVDYE